jgi:hypothetical protein
LINLVSTCIQCGSPVTDSLDSKVEEQGQLKRGKYVNSVWIYADAQIEGVKNDQREESMTRVATPSDVSPNTPKADEANL